MNSAEDKTSPLLTKQCSKCALFFHLSSFYRYKKPQNSHKHGIMDLESGIWYLYGSTCKECQRKKARIFYNKHKKQKIKKSIIWNIKNIEKARKSKREYMKRVYAKRNSDHTKSTI